jgi:phosphoribosylglycinamide formyltransferase-1
MAQDTIDTVGRIVVLASGSGSNLQILLDSAESSWSVVGVVSDQPDARALQRAAGANLPSRVVEWGHYADRNTFTDAICAAAGEFAPDYIVLAGFMRVLGPSAITHFPGQIINVHPSLLPAFPGAHGVRDALAYGAKVTGVTLHFVDEHLDHGPIIAQEALEVLVGDDEAALHGRIQAIEHRLLPEVVTRLAKGEFDISGRIVKGRVNA